MAKAHEIGTSSIKSVFCFAYQHGFPNHFKNNVGGKADTPQFRGGNPYFFSENLYQSVSFIYASMYREYIHAIHIVKQFTQKIETLCRPT